MYIYDSFKKEKVLFEPIKEKRASIYVCGPTVYDNAHLGHARSSITYDLLRRVLEISAYQVVLVKNFTDIDDKIIKKVKETGKTLKDLTEYYMNSYSNDMDALNIIKPDIEPKATESMNEIIQMIQNLLDKDIAYKISNGDVYFDISKDIKHGSLSKWNTENTMSRIETISEKRNPEDYVLWKNNNDIVFNSPFGEGRPGWHIECSAMIEKIFPNGDEFSIDIHGGGSDLMFPHHENEASQSRCATGHELSKYWMHNGFVRINDKIMSKSLGNSFFVKDALKEYNGEVLRNYLMSTHYRSDFNFSERDLLKSKVRLDKLYRLKKRVFDVEATDVNNIFKEQLMSALNDDINISEALAVIDNVISLSNNLLDDNSGFKEVVLANINFISEVLGIGYQNPYDYFQIGVEDKEEINDLIAKRNLAREEKDFSLSDSIRDDLISRGIKIIDTPNGTVWERI